MQLTSSSFGHLAAHSRGVRLRRPGSGAARVFGANRNPQLSWSDVPAATRSLVLICVDSDVPTRADDVNQEGRACRRACRARTSSTG